MLIHQKYQARYEELDSCVVLSLDEMMTGAKEAKRKLLWTNR